MRIMTSNIWGDYFGNEVSAREGQLYNVYKKYDPDIIGMQEATGAWYLSELFQSLEEDGYLFVGTHYIHPEKYTFKPGAPLYEGGSYVPMVIKKDKFKVLSHGYEGFRNTPDASKAITWAVLESKEDGKVFGVCNTHFWWMRGTESEQTRKALRVLDYSFEDHCGLRADNAKQLTHLMQYLHDKYACPVFAFGDMNATITESVFDVYKDNGIQKLFDMAEHKDMVCTTHGDPVRGEDSAFHGVRATDTYIDSFRRVLCLPERKGEKAYFTSIDHMIGLGEGFEVVQYRVVEDQDALDATDHSPVYADIEIL